MTDPSNNPDLWRHKARALLVPTPLALVDPAGEPARVEELLGWLQLKQTDRNDLHDECRKTAFGVHVPSGVGPATAAPPIDNGLVDVPPLRHPLGGPGFDGSRHKLADLCAAWRMDWNALTPPTDHATYATLWYHLQRAAPQAHLPWHAKIPANDELRDHPWFAQRNVASALVGARFDGGAACLLFVHCGPVQSFITAARRTSDLWLGSYLVSLLSYQATRAVAKQCGPDAIIYPHLASAPLALRGQFPERKFDVSPCLQACLQANQPNRFVAIVGEAYVDHVAQAVGKAVLTRWKTMADRVKKALISQSEKDGFDCLDGFDGFGQQIAAHPDIDIITQPWPTDPRQLEAMLSVSGKPTESTDSNTTPRYGEVFGLGRTTLSALRRVLGAAPPDGDRRSKCTQCGSREAMGPKHGGARDHRQWWESFRTNLQSAKTSQKDDTKPEVAAAETIDFRKGEALCAVCLTKRFAHRFDLAAQDPDIDLGLDWNNSPDRLYLRFPSVASIASAPARKHILEHATNEAKRAWTHEVDAAHNLLGFTPPGNLLPGLGDIGRDDNRFLNPDGTWMYDRSYKLDTLLRDHDDPETPDQGETLGTHLVAAKSLLRKLFQPTSDDSDASPVRPTPYYAVVALDVDQMGKWLDGTHDNFPYLSSMLSSSTAPSDESKCSNERRPISPSLHSEISRRQSNLATNTLHTIVEQNLGRLVYSGGDDVLAFLPLHTVWACLAELTAAFQHRDALGPKVKVSAGVAISDWRSPLSLALRHAREAEARAKGPRDSIAVHLAIRSGAPVDVLLQWGDLAELVQNVNRIADTKTSPTDEASNATNSEPLMRPAAIDRLRRELHTLRSPDLKDPFDARVKVLLRTIPAFVERLLANRHPVDQQPHDELGGVVEALLLLRFLAREQGGIPYTAPLSREEKS